MQLITHNWACMEGSPIPSKDIYLPNDFKYFFACIPRTIKSKQKLHPNQLRKRLFHPNVLQNHFQLLSIFQFHSIIYTTQLHHFFISQHLPHNHHQNQNMRLKWLVMMSTIAMLMSAAYMDTEVEEDDSAIKPVVKIVKGKKLCDKGWECKGLSEYCCNHTISDYFQTYQFENLFSKRNTPVAHAVGFWDYHSFITAAALYQPKGFGTTGRKLTGMKELAAFLGHVGSKTSCQYSL